MTTYYYDATYDLIAHAKKLGNWDKIKPLIAKMLDANGQVLPLFAGILRMRPIGVQTGHEQPDGSPTADSFIFAGSKTNQDNSLLNGPADNPKSSCLSCHGTAGTGEPMAPGFMNNDDVKNFVNGPRFMDYSQQLALAKRNYETRARSE